MSHEITLHEASERAVKAIRDPQINDRWKDGRGEIVTVIAAAFNRVTFVRDGYEYPCSYPLVRFVKEFSLTRKNSADAK